MGSDAFVEWIYDRFLSRAKMDNRELPGLKELERGTDSVEEIAHHVSVAFGVPAEELYHRRSVHRAARGAFMELCCVYLARKMSFAEIGERVGGVSVAALSQNRKRLRSRMKRDPQLRAHFERLIQILGGSSS